MQNRHLSLLLLLLFAGCSTSTSERSSAPLTVSLSSGGGFSGMHSGYSITPSGAITYWRTFRGKEEIDTLGTLPDKSVAAFRDSILAVDFASIKQRESGNMTTLLEITLGEERFIFSWPTSYAGDSGIPQRIWPLYEVTHKALQPFMDSTGIEIQ